MPDPIDTSYRTQKPFSQPEAIKKAANPNTDRAKIPDGWLPSAFVRFPKKVFEGVAFCQLKMNATVDAVKNYPNRKVVLAVAVLAVFLGIMGFLAMQRMTTMVLIGALFLGVPLAYFLAKAVATYLLQSNGYFRLIAVLDESCFASIGIAKSIVAIPESVLKSTNEQ